MDRLWVRLTLGFLVVTVVTLGLAAVLVTASVRGSFRQYVGQAESLILAEPWRDRLLEHYSVEGGWEGVDELLPGAGRSQAQGRGRGAQSFVADSEGVVRAATVPEWIGQSADAVAGARTVPLEVDGRTVGWLGQATPGLERLAEAQSSFDDQVRRGLLLAGVLSSIIAVALGGLLAYSVARPLRDLARHVGALRAPGGGEVAPAAPRDGGLPPMLSRADEGGPTEVRELARAFNELSRRLESADAQRQRMAADVAHELRTPVTVLRGHLEAMMDGVYPIDAEHLAVAYDETLHLARLVADLQLLTGAETGRLQLALQATDPAAAVEAVTARFAPLARDAGVSLEEVVEDALPSIAVDPARFQQVLDNLVVNALRHTSPGGQIQVRVARTPEGVAISIRNSGATAPEQLERAFDRFWRSDEARARDAGGSGLGLAISREIVRLHGGAIRAESEGGWTQFDVLLPDA